jgi:hypothetical protein
MSGGNTMVVLKLNGFSVKAKIRFPHGYFWMECGYEYRLLCGAFWFCNSSSVAAGACRLMG